MHVTATIKARSRLTTSTRLLDIFGDFAERDVSSFIQNQLLQHSFSPSLFLDLPRIKYSLKIQMIECNNYFVKLIPCREFRETNDVAPENSRNSSSSEPRILIDIFLLASLFTFRWTVLIRVSNVSFNSSKLWSILPFWGKVWFAKSNWSHIGILTCYLLEFANHERIYLHNCEKVSLPWSSNYAESELETFLFRTNSKTKSNTKWALWTQNQLKPVPFCISSTQNCILPYNFHKLQRQFLPINGLISYSDQK